MPLIGLQQGLAGVIKRQSAVVVPPPVQTARGRPVVSGNTVLTDQGTRMRGCTFGLDGPGSLSTAFTVDKANWELIRSKKLNCIRLDVTLSINNVTLATQLPYIDIAVNNAAQTGMYIIIMCSGTQLAYNKAELVQFWSTVAARYKDNTHVFYEITNEPAWVYNGTVLQDMDDLNEIIINAAPNTYVGVLDFTTLQAGDANTLAASFAALGPTYAPTGRSFICAHLYFSSTQTQLQTLKNAYPVFMTEHIWQSTTETDTSRMQWCEAVGVSWISWMGRCGRLSDIKDPTGTSIASLDRLLNQLATAGITWTADTFVGGTVVLPDGRGLTIREDGTGWVKREDGGYIRREEFVDGVIVPPPTTLAYDPPATWVKTFSDDFNTITAQTGPNSIDSTIWRQPNFGTGAAHQGSSFWHAGQSLEATGTSLKIHTEFNGANNTWWVDGFQAGYQSSNASGPGYFAGFQEFHYRFRARYSHAVAPGVGGFALFWPASNIWSSEMDWVEMPGDNKTRVDITMHWDSRGQHDLNTNNEMRTQSVLDIDLTQFHIWDCRRTYRLVNGVVLATVEVWIDGNKVPTPAEWIDNAYLTDAMMPGFATYVAPNVQWAADWYGLTKANTPGNSYFEIDYAYVWTPPTTSPTNKSITLNPSNPGTISETSTGSGVNWNTTVTTQNIDSITWQVLNQAGTGRGTPAIVSMAAQSGSNVSPADLSGPGGGSVGNVRVMLQGQSNAVFWYDADGTYTTSTQFKTMVQQLTGLSSGQFDIAAQRSDFTPSAATLFSGTFTYGFGGPPPEWLYALGGNLADPATWPNDAPMDALKAYCIANQGAIASNRPWLLIRMHNEYDSGLGLDTERNVYEAANREFIKRWRSYMGGRATSLLPAFQVMVPYGVNVRADTSAAIRRAWKNQAADASQNFYHGVGSALDSQDRGDASHWTQDSATRVAQRMAIRIARWLWQNGYSANDLSWLPDEGPKIIAADRVSGDATKLDVTVQHNMGTDIIVPATSNYSAFRIFDAGTQRNVTAIVRTAANKMRLTLNGALGANSLVTLDYGLISEYGVVANQITDDWHTLSKPALAAGVTNLSAVKMPLARNKEEIIIGANANVTTTVAGQRSVIPHFVATNDFLRVWETNNAALSKDSSPVTIAPISQTGRSLVINPANVGSRAVNSTVPTTITTTGITSITWVVVNPDFSWPNGGTQVSTSGSVVINPVYTLSGQFLKVIDTNDFTYYLDGGAVTIT